MEIKYVGYYCTEKNTDAYISPAAVEKMTYIAESLVKTGHDVEIISLSGVGRKRFNRRTGKELGTGRKLTYISALPRTNAIFRRINASWTKIGLFLYLLKAVKRKELILVYHSVLFPDIWRMIQKIKKCTICLEVEEIYQDAQKMSKGLRKREYRAFQWADAYIFPTDVLAQKLNASARKPYLVVHGSYKLQEKKESIFKDGLAHVVYAGTFDQKKGGAKIAIEAGKYLGNNVHMHIIGFGSQQETEQIIQMISECSRKAECQITYDGCKMGEDYIRFIQSCDVGLSTQKSENKLNETSFPSKILSYLSNDLNVVTSDLKVVRESAVGDLVLYYSSDNPQQIALVIEKALEMEHYGRERVRKLDQVFSVELGKMIERLSERTEDDEI